MSNLSWRNLFGLKKSKILSDLEQSRSDVIEGQRAFGIQQEAASGIQGGFTNDNMLRANWEYDKAKTAATEGLNLEEQFLTEQERQQNEAIKKAKKLSLVKTIGSVAAGAANFVPGVGPGLSAGIDVATDVTTDLMGGQADYSNIDWGSLAGLTGYLEKRKQPSAGFQTDYIDYTPSTEYYG